MIVYDSVYKDMKPGLSLRIKQMAPVLAACGCKAFKFPPFLNTTNPHSLGYDPRTDLDVGQWEPLHITGTAAELKGAIDTLHANGLLVIQDWVCRQYSGKPPLYERGPDGKIDPTLFPKPLECFSPPAPRDAMFDTDNGEDDGIIVSYAAANRYMLHGKIQAGKWQESVLGIDGYRLDEGKGLSIEVIRAFNAARPGKNYAEVYTGDRSELRRYVRETGMCVLDFPAHYAYRNVSNGAPLSSLVGNSFASEDPEHSAIFVESNDTDGPGGVVNFKVPLYVHALTMPAKAVLVFAKDYEEYGLARWLRNAMWFSHMFAIGKLGYSIVEDTFLAWWRDGDGGEYGWSGGMLAAISSDPINWQSRWMWTPFRPGTVLHNYAPTLATASRVNQDGWSYVTLSPNYFGDGLSYGLFAPDGVQGQAISHPPVGRAGSGAFLDFSSITVKPQVSEERR